MSYPSTPSWREIGDLHALLDPESLAKMLRAAELPVDEAVANYKLNVKKVSIVDSADTFY